MFRHLRDYLWKWRKPRTPSLESTQMKLSDHDLAWAAFDVAAKSLDAAKGAYQSKVHMLAPPWRFVYVMLTLDGQVNNGGFHQFFTNARGVFDSHVMDDTARLEHDTYKGILTRAFTQYKGIDYQDGWANVGKSWDSFAAPYKEGRFKQEDSDYYVTEPSLVDVVGSHIRNHFDDYRSNKSWREKVPSSPVIVICCIIGFLVTIWMLLDAKITLVLAHNQWEIHQETAIKIAAAVWTPITVVLLVLKGCLCRTSSQTSEQE